MTFSLVTPYLLTMETLNLKTISVSKDEVVTEVVHGGILKAGRESIFLIQMYRSLIDRKRSGRFSVWTYPGRRLDCT